MNRWCLPLLLLLPACAIGLNETGRVIDVRKVADVKVGVTTKQQVLDLFGPPTSLSRLLNSTRFEAPPQAPQSDGAGRPTPEDVYAWEYREDHEKFFTLLLYTYWGRVTLVDSLMIVFDGEERVKYLAFARQTDAEPPEEAE